MQKSAYLLIALCFPICALSRAQTKTQAKRKSTPSAQNFLQVDRIPPPYCDSHLAAVSTMEGSDAYRRLRAITEALITAQEAADDLRQAGESIKNEENPTEAFSELFEGEQKTIDGLHCAAQVMHEYQSKEENKQDDLISVSLIVGFNKEAYAIQLLRASQKERFSRKQQATPAQSISDGESLQKIQDLQRDGGSSIVEASALAGSSSADMSDKNAKTIEFSQLSCSENEEILEMVKSPAKNTQTIYGQSAKMILDLIQRLKCRMPHP